MLLQLLKNNNNLDSLFMEDNNLSVEGIKELIVIENILDKKLNL